MGKKVLGIPYWMVSNAFLLLETFEVGRGRGFGGN
jgi:hypothetical protein